MNLYVSIVEPLNALCNEQVEYNKKGLVTWLKKLPLLSPSERKAFKKIWRLVYSQHDLNQEIGFAHFAYSLHHQKPISVANYLLWAEEKEYPSYLASLGASLQNTNSLMDDVTELFKNNDLKGLLEHPRLKVFLSSRREHWYLILCLMEKHNAWASCGPLLMQHHDKVPWPIGVHFLEHMPIHWLAHVLGVPDEYVDLGLHCADLCGILDNSVYSPIGYQDTVIQESDIYL